ncbi:hypothetical protein OSSY52_01860 [Tepiditoga spiralis]|uniref:Amidohydrolase 3 domain-containing protein n=1 Tax=Tepiditoga spiralis TaxID=2108365 RepID=A0A7G1G2G1_9BACT|nr:amidohydrolase family protein [Tepiditoga spiralis]BBE30045.1 hypothetical protein OSSY52_01860 [Tepiditoga spiralis]
MYKLKNDGIFHYINTKVNSNKYITPLITDTHMHLLGLGEKLRNPNLEGKSLKEIKNIILNKKDEKKIILRGWSEEFANPTKEYLDEISNVPVFLIRRCGHVAVINSKVFELIDFSNYEEYIDYKTGRITEQSLELVYQKLGYYTDINEDLKVAEEYLLKKGYGYIHSDDLHGIKNMIDGDKIKIFEKVAVNNYNELIDYYNSGYFNKYKSVKVYTDGSLGGRTAYLINEYNDFNTKGEFVWDLEELKKVLIFCENNNLHLALHAIGDEAIENILNVFSDVKPKNIHRIIHASILHDEQLKKIKKLNIILDMQPAFIESDKSILNKRLGKRENLTYRFFDIYNKSIPLFFSSDSPIEVPDWYRDIITLNKLGLPLKYILNTMIYFPKVIDNFERNFKIGYLEFDNNPFEKINKPKVNIDL